MLMNSWNVAEGRYKNYKILERDEDHTGRKCESHLQVEVGALAMASPLALPSNR